MHRGRRLIAGIVLVALLGVGVTEARRHWPGDVRTGAAAAHGAQVLRCDVRSRFVRRTLPQVAAIPRGAGRTKRPLLVFRHVAAGTVRNRTPTMRHWRGAHDGG